MYDVIVVGGGHAGCEAALATSRTGNKTLLVTGNIKNIADNKEQFFMYSKNQNMKLLFTKQ